MGSYYLRMEATNFDHFLADTQDLSTIRGGGLLLLRAPEKVERFEGLGLRKITSGASTGLFRFEASSGADAAQRRDDVARALRQDPELRHATFSVDVHPAGGDDVFLQDLESLSALNRFGQLASPSLAVPGDPPGEGTVVPCSEDRLRPARTRGIGSGKEREKISESVWVRRSHGRTAKQEFYRDETETAEGPGLEVSEGFSNSFEDLAKDPVAGQVPANLEDKIAVVYVDGNDFGAMTRRHGDTEAKLVKLDGYLRGRRREILRDVVSRARRMAMLREGADGRGPVRLETLLWGGDEIVWVVPAWAGWWLVERFYAKPWIYAGEELTFACGLVFCQHKAPIHRMRALAEELAGLAKAKSRERNLVAYEVLESFDRLGDELDEYRRSRIPAGADPACLLLAPEHVAAARPLYAGLRRHLPARQVHAVARAAQRGESSKEPRDKIFAALPPARSDDLEKLLSHLAPEGAGEDVAWVHLLTLWDYLEPLPPGAPGGSPGAAESGP